MGHRLSLIFRLLLFISIVIHQICSSDSPSDLGAYRENNRDNDRGNRHHNDEEYHWRYGFPYQNYVPGVYPRPPGDIECACEDPYEQQVCGPSYGDGCEIQLYGRPSCAAYTKCLPGCYCDNLRGWYRHPMTLKCVKYDECPKQYNYFNCRGYFEEYRLGDNSCKDSCDFHTGVVNCVVEQCIPGCYCKKGYARSKRHNNQCVPIYECSNVNYNGGSESAYYGRCPQTPKKCDKDYPAGH